MRLLIAIALVLIVGCQSISDESIIKSLGESVGKYNYATENMKFEELVNFYPRIIKEDSVERKKIIDAFITQKKKLRKTGSSIGKINTSEPINFTREGNESHALLRQQTRLYSLDRNLTSNSYLYAYTQNYGEDWVIMEFDYIQKVFPDFKFKFKPTEESQVIEDSCRHFYFDLFGYDMCIDRHLESGEYKVIDSYKHYSIIEKVTPKTEFSQIEIEMINSAIKKWERKASIDCVFPIISKTTPNYMESDIRTFSVEDIYGIPFEWKENKRDEYYRDTLPGYFVKSSDLNRIDSFHILYEPEDFE